MIYSNDVSDLIAPLRHASVFLLNINYIALDTSAEITNCFFLFVRYFPFFLNSVTAIITGDNINRINNLKYLMYSCNYHVIT